METLVIPALLALLLLFLLLRKGRLARLLRFLVAAATLFAIAYACGLRQPGWYLLATVVAIPLSKRRYSEKEISRQHINATFQAEKCLAECYAAGNEPMCHFCGQPMPITQLGGVYHNLKTHETYLACTTCKASAYREHGKDNITKIKISKPRLRQKAKARQQKAAQ